MSRTALALTLALPLLAQAPPANRADFERLFKKLSNWGRWGPTDELGTINLITPPKRRAATRLVREGVPVSLSHDAEKAQAADNPRPFIHEMINHGQTPNATSHGDLFTVAHHGLAHTHIDALSHFFHEGKMYNGYSRDHVTAKGAAKLDVYRMKQGIFTRGILVDIPRLKRLPYLEPGTPILPADLDAWEKFARLKVQPGDVLLIRTGRWKLRAENVPVQLENESRSEVFGTGCRW
jgi:kynurenine formamidase